jgi:hypothetical protein
MEPRKYKAAYVIAKIVEVLSWLIIAGGIIGGIALGEAVRNQGIGFAVIGISIVFGLILVFASQLTLIFIDTENNTRIIATESIKTNAMLSETIGTIAANLQKLANKG